MVSILVLCFMNKSYDIWFCVRLMSIKFSQVINQFNMYKFTLEQYNNILVSLQHLIDIYYIMF